MIKIDECLFWWEIAANFVEVSWRITTFEKEKLFISNALIKSFILMFSLKATASLMTFIVGCLMAKKSMLILFTASIRFVETTVGKIERFSFISGHQTDGIRKRPENIFILTVEGILIHCGWFKWFMKFSLCFQEKFFNLAWIN